MSETKKGSHPHWPRSTPLHDAVRDGDLSRVTALLRNGANPDVQAGKGDGQTPLHCAAMRGQVEMVRLLLDHGATVDFRNDFAGYTPLHTAVSKSSYDEASISTIELLLTRGADLEARTHYGNTPLYLSLRPNTTVLELLLARGVKVDARDVEGRTILMKRTFRLPSLFRCAELLLKHGATLEAQDHQGHTALILAAARGDLDWARFLLSGGADATARDFNGRTAADHAAAPPPQDSLDAMKLRAHERARKLDLNELVWQRRPQLASLLREAGR